MQNDKTGVNLEKLSPSQILIILLPDSGKFMGALFSGFYRNAMSFRNECEMIFAISSIYDSIQLPQASFEARSFGIKTMKTVVRKVDHLVDTEMENIIEKGKATFVVHIRFRQNASWQGSITWAEKDKSRNFRSALEMLKLMDEARNPGVKETIAWDEET